MVEKGFAAVEGDWQNLVAAVLAAQRQILPDLRLSTLGKPLSNPVILLTRPRSTFLRLFNVKRSTRLFLKSRALKSHGEQNRKVEICITWHT